MNENLPEARDCMLDAFEHAPEGIRGVLEDWDTFDEALQLFYIEEMEWIFDEAVRCFNSTNPEMQKLKLAAMEFAKNLLPLDNKIKSITGWILK